MVFVTENEKTEFFSLEKQDFSHIDGCFLDGYEC
jgi:hypothetical protein